MIVIDWLGKFLNLPKHFLPSDPGNGGGIIQGSASESILVAVLAAREEKVREMKIIRPDLTEDEVRSKLVGYGSIHSNSAIEKSGLLAAIKMRLLEADDNSIMRGETVEKAIEDDTANGLIPFICIATIGTTGTCAFDNMEEIGPVCKKYNVWMHIGMLMFISFACIILSLITVFIFLSHFFSHARASFYLLLIFYISFATYIFFFYFLKMLHTPVLLSAYQNMRTSKKDWNMVIQLISTCTSGCWSILIVPLCGSVMRPH